MANCFVFRIDSRAGHPVYIGRGRKDRRGRYVVGTWRRFHYEIAQLIQDGLTRPLVIVADDLSDEKAKEEQRRLIALYGRRDLGLGPLWNLTDGGPGIPGSVANFAADGVPV
jgi:hypothetical protein